MTRVRRLMQSAPPLLAALVSVAAAEDGGQSDRQARGEDSSATLRTEHELTIAIEVPTLPGEQCEASSSTSYHQRNTVARIESTIQVAACPGAASGKFDVTVRIRDESGALQSLEFTETWQRSDARDVSFAADYPIGENVELVSARVRGLSCKCAAADAQTAED